MVDGNWLPGSRGINPDSGGSAAPAAPKLDSADHVL